MSEPSPAADLRPRAVGELLDAAFKTTRRHFKQLVLCVVLVAVPVEIIATLIDLSTTENAFDFSVSTTTYTDEGTYYGGQLVKLLLSGVATTLATGAALEILGSDVRGGTSTAGASLRAAAGRFWGLVGVSVLYFLLMVVGFICLIIPGIWFYVAAALAPAALLYERVGAWEAIKRSLALVKGRWWQTLAVLFVMGLIVAILGAVMGALLGSAILADSDNESVNAVIVTLVNIVIQLIGLPLSAAAVAMLYFDGRVRKEGLDLELQAERIEDTSAPLWAPPSPPPPADEGFFPPSQPPPGR